MGAFLFGIVVGANLFWAIAFFRRDGHWRKLNARRRSSDPQPSRKSAVPVVLPKQPLTAQLIRYWAWQNEQVRQAWTDPRLGEPWPEDCQPDQQDVTIRLDEGQVQRGGFGGGRATAKPLIKPQPTGGRQLSPFL
jgi:hypothetical protein